MDHDQGVDVTVTPVATVDVKGLIQHTKMSYLLSATVHFSIMRPSLGDRVKYSTPSICRPCRCLRYCHLLAVPSCAKYSFASQAFCVSSPEILSLCISTHLTVLLLLNPVLNLIFALLPITSSHSYTSASDSTFDYWRYINNWLTMTLTWFVRPSICPSRVSDFLETGKPWKLLI